MTCLICHDTHSVRYGCDGCIDVMRRRLRDIETYAAMLPHLMQPLRGIAARRAPGYSSTPPVRIDALVALDPRSRPGASVDRDWDPEIDDDHAMPSILGALHSMARWIREEQELPEPSRAPTIAREIGYLLGAITWCARDQWITELFDEIHDLHGHFRRLVKDAPPRALSDCLEVGCIGSVFWTRDIPDDQQPGQTHDAAKCVDCGRIYSGVDLIRLKVWGARRDPTTHHRQSPMDQS